MSRSRQERRLEEKEKRRQEKRAKGAGQPTGPAIDTWDDITNKTLRLTFLMLSFYAAALGAYFFGAAEAWNNMLDISADPFGIGASFMIGKTEITKCTEELPELISLSNLHFYLIAICIMASIYTGYGFRKQIESSRKFRFPRQLAPRRWWVAGYALFILFAVFIPPMGIGNLIGGCSPVSFFIRGCISAMLTSFGLLFALPIYYAVFKPKG